MNINTSEESWGVRKYSLEAGVQDSKSEVGCIDRGKPNGTILFQKGINHLPQSTQLPKKIIPHTAENTNTKKKYGTYFNEEGCSTYLINFIG